VKIHTGAKVTELHHELDARGLPSRVHALKVGRLTQEKNKVAETFLTLSFSLPVRLGFLF
jgi:hypothetical protein